MRELVFVAALAVSSQLAPAASRTERAIYVGGSAALSKDAEGTFDLEDAGEFHFQYATGTFAIPYERISRFEIGEKPGRRKKAQLLTISFKDEKGTGQAAIFEVSKDLALVVTPVLEARSGRRAGTASGGDSVVIDLVPVTVTSKPTGAFVYFWGQTVGKTPVTTKLAPGTYTVTVEAEGMLTWTHDVVVETGKPVNVLAELAQPVKVTVVGEDR